MTSENETIHNNNTNPGGEESQKKHNVAVWILKVNTQREARHNQLSCIIYMDIVYLDFETLTIMYSPSFNMIVLKDNENSACVF
jgi:hypothetical protein